MTPEKEERIGRCLKCKHLSITTHVVEFANGDGHICEARCKEARTASGKPTEIPGGKIVKECAGFNVEKPTATVIGYLEKEVSPKWCPLDYTPMEMESASINTDIIRLSNKYFKLVDELKKIDNKIDNLNERYLELNGVNAPAYNGGKK